MSPARLAVPGLILVSLLAYGTYRLVNVSEGGPGVSPAVNSSQPQMAVPSAPSGSRAAVGAPRDDSGTLDPTLSTRLIDFGRVPVGSPASQRLFVMSGTAVELRIAGSEGRRPFEVPRRPLNLKPTTSTAVPVRFDPLEPGRYETQIVLLFGAPVNREIAVTVRGEAFLASHDIGVIIPDPPDQIIREYKEQQVARLLHEAVAAQAVKDGQDADRDRPNEALEGDRATREPQENPEGRPAGRASMPPAAIIAAFGVAMSPAEDPNNIPAEIPPGDTVPDLPPADEDMPPADDDADSEVDESKLDDDSDIDPDGKKDPKAKKVPSFTIAPNSSVLVYSSRENLSLQTMTGTSADGGKFRLHGRIHFPDMSFAFGQLLGLKQWGDIKGELASDGTVQMSLVLRVEDPNRTVTLDIPIDLTTGTTVGYSAAGRIMFAQGVPRNPATGDVKMVGIVNIPLGKGSSVDNAPIFLELLGRLTL